MKRVLIAVFAGSSLLMSGCDTSLLDTSPDNKYVESNFWKTEAAANAALTGCYTVLHYAGLFGGTATPLWEEGVSPNAYCYSGGTLGFNSIGDGQQSASTGGIISSRWNDSYQGIGRCNSFIVNVDQITDMDEALRERMKSEAHFLRALYYFELATYYGGVPIVLDPPNRETQSDLPRNTHEEVIQQVLADLSIAEAGLPDKYGAADQGRATKGAALALKARVLLYEASPLLNTSNDVSKWTAAANAAKAVIDFAPEAGYGLFNDYRGLFLPANENNEEVIFDVQFIFPDEGNSFDLICAQYNTNAPLLGLAEAYEMSNGLPITDPASAYDAANPYANRDPRLYATIVYPGDMYKGKAVTASTYAQTGYAMKKYSIYDREKPPADKADLKDGQSETNFIVLRYGDILLMYAEALNESDPGNSDILTYLHEVRDRAGMPDIASGLNQAEMRDAIRQERRVELAGEALYYNDVRRWKTAEVVMNGPIYNAEHELIVERNFDPARDYWWPIPQAELDLNERLDQNVGY
jgi:hypothetical protein